MKNLTLKEIIKSLDETLQEQDQKNLEGIADLLEPYKGVDDLLTDDPDILISDDNPLK